MDITRLPFNALIGLEAASPDSDDLVVLPAGSQYGNHLGTVHAAALLALAEAGSGVFLQRHMEPMPGMMPVVRRLEAKFRKAARGRVAARCSLSPDVVAGWSAELAKRGRVSASLPIEVVDGTDTVVLSTQIEWFITIERAVP